VEQGQEGVKPDGQPKVINTCQWLLMAKHRMKNAMQVHCHFYEETKRESQQEQQKLQTQ